MRSPSSTTLIEKIVALGERRTVAYVFGGLAALGVAFFLISRIVEGDARQQLVLAAVLSGACALAFALVSLVLGFVSFVGWVIERLFRRRDGPH